MRTHAHSSCFQLPFVPGRDGPGNPEKNPARTPCRKPSPTKPAELHTAITLSFAFDRRAHTRALGSWSPAAVPAAETAERELLLVGECGGRGLSGDGFSRARRRRLTPAACLPRSLAGGACERVHRAASRCGLTSRPCVQRCDPCCEGLVDAMSGESALGRRPREAVWNSSARPPKVTAKRGRPASKTRASCPVCKNVWKACSVACPGRASGWLGEQAPDAEVQASEVQASCSLSAGDGGAQPALQPAIPHVVDAGEVPTPDARGHTVHACSPGQRVPLRAAARDAALAPEELGADVEQAAAEPRRSQRDGRGRADPPASERPRVRFGRVRFDAMPRQI